MKPLYSFTPHMQQDGNALAHKMLPKGIVFTRFSLSSRSRTSTPVQKARLGRCEEIQVKIRNVYCYVYQSPVPGNTQVRGCRRVMADTVAQR